MLTWAYPLAVVLLPIPILLWWLLPALSQPRPALGVPFLDRLAQASGQSPQTGTPNLRTTPATLLCAAAFWLCAVTAFARPQYVHPPVTKTIPVRDMLLAVDLSGSMQTQDFTSASGKKSDRLTAVKEVLDDFLKHREGDRVGLIVFGSAPFMQAPFTQDIKVCRELLSQTTVGMAGPQTALGDAIGLAITTFDRSTFKERVLILLTDGNDTASLIPPDQAAQIARDKGIVIHTIAVGDPKAAGEAKLDEQTLKQIAQTTSGLYSHANNRQELQDTYARLDALESSKAQTLTHRRVQDLYFWPLGIGLLISMLPFLRHLLPARSNAAPTPPMPAVPKAGGAA